MGYCRFENTYKDLCDCEEYFGDDDLSISEKNYRDKLIALCKDITENYGDEL
jgi:hypothetical protein